MKEELLGPVRPPLPPPRLRRLGGRGTHGGLFLNRKGHATPSLLGQGLWSCSTRRYKSCGRGSQARSRGVGKGTARATHPRTPSLWTLVAWTSVAAVLLLKGLGGARGQWCC